MSSIYKLSVKGIRAFEPETDETIQFGFPLTLICGQNGCGKTTVIECLKYATTGNLPPNSKGGAFVHDPGLDARAQVAGQVKLAFRNANGKSMIVTRTVSATVKKGHPGVLTFKTLEGQFAYIEQGQKTSISSKNAELDSQIPTFLGASTAILDNVIFCHQDESLWPLSEASVLKKKFDDIFEASKYTKVIDHLKTIRKDMGVDIKLIEQSVGHLKIDKERAAKVKDKLAQMTSSVDAYTEEISNLNIRIERKEKEAEDLFATNQEFQKTLSDYENLLMKKNALEEAVEKYKSTITLLPESDEELYHKQENFASITAEKNAKVEDLQSQSSILESQLTEKTREYNELLRLDGLFKGKKLEYEENVSKIANIISANAQSVNLSSDASVSSFKKTLESRLTLLKSDHKTLQVKNKDKETAQSNKLQEVKNSILKNEQTRGYLTDELSSQQQNLSAFNKKLESTFGNEAELTLKREELAQTLHALAEKKKLNEVKELDAKVVNANEEISRLEFEMDEISKKLVTSGKQSELKSRLTYLESSVKSKDEEIKTIMKSVCQEYKNLVGCDIDIYVAESKFVEAYSKKMASFEEQQRNVFSLESELDSAKRSRQSATDAKNDNNKKLQQLQSDITAVISEEEMQDYENFVQELEDDYRTVMEDVSTSEVTKSYGNFALEVAEKNNCCLLCKRLFDKPELQGFIEEVKRSFDEAKIQEVKARASEIEKDLEDAKKVGLKVITYRECLASRSTFDSDIESANTAIKSLGEKLEEETRKLDSNKASLESAGKLRRPLSDATRLNQEVQDLDLEVDELKDDLQDFGGGSGSLSQAELQTQQQNLNKKIREIRANLTNFTEEKYRVQKEIQKLENKVKDTKLVISNLERSLAEMENTKRLIAETSVRIGELEQKLANVKEQVEKSLEQEQSERHCLQQIQSENAQHDERMKKEVDQLSDLHSLFLSLTSANAEFEERSLPKFKENSVQMETVLAECHSIKTQIGETSNAVKLLEKEVMDSSRIEYNILANIEYRTQLHRLDETDFQLNSIDIENAQCKKSEYQEHSRRLREELSHLTSQHAGKIGEVKQIKDQVSALKRELETEYKNVDKLYHEEWIKLQTNLLVSNDIQNYSKALDNAIMKYHSIKMEDINRILNELWLQTYKGSDITTIAIKSDVNLQAKGNRSYNYRVVMVKESTELDMRGRCSAGQKVLASILIRLALAECFGANCGMIALDEPTTNLDSDNAEALASALNNIIEHRKQQSNFQLIVITHDEKFLTHIRGDRFTDHFYRIQRDEKSKSRIYSLPISRISEI
ncbi:uncharacterized protein LODBEIA_P32670 [Lodderomyces beijingensis]|uniref:Rad50/SbcC-type AAA domain-containing protein n=1 Tax=Lodderomyces beijingensis TaxID=1775926 RepID=A0ABP0ZLL0_9ASCO